MSNVKLLPLPSVLLNWPPPADHVAIRDYAHACVEASTEALRAENARLRRSLHEAVIHGNRQSGRAERLAEALRVIEGFTMSQFPDAADMAGACVETAHNALHPTAAQENDHA